MRKALLLILVRVAAASIVQKLASDFPGWKPNAILDIGANVGDWAREAHGLYPDAAIFCLEASSLHKEHLTERLKDIPGAGFNIAVLYHTAGQTISFYDNGGEYGGTGNSIYKEATNFFAAVKPQTRITSTVDDEVAKSHLKGKIIDYIKIDVQGAEGVVLQGALQTLAQATFVQMEISIVSYNPGGACFGEIEFFMAQQGYYLYDVGQLNSFDFYGKKSVNQFDVLFIRGNSERRPDELKNPKLQYCLQDTTPKEIQSFAKGYTYQSLPYDENIIFLAGVISGGLASIILPSLLRPRRMKVGGAML